MSDVERAQVQDTETWWCPEGHMSYEPPDGQPTPLVSALGWHRPGETPRCPFCLALMVRATSRPPNDYIPLTAHALAEKLHPELPSPARYAARHGEDPIVRGVRRFLLWVIGCLSLWVAGSAAVLVIVIVRHR